MKHHTLKAMLVLLALVFSLGANAQDPIQVKEIVLKNGLHVFLHEDHSKPQVFGCVVTRAGGKNDPSDATGMAHYMEHMLFKGTTELGTTDWEKERPHIDKIFELYDELGKTQDEEKRKEIQMKINKESLEAGKYAIPNEMSNIINSMGGTNLNAGTGWDQTMYYNAFPASQMERWLDLYAHRFIEPVFRSFQAELEVVYEEKNMYQDIFFFPILEKFNAQFFKNHPYGQQTLIGTAEDLKNPSLSKMKAFYDTYYVANNMGLVISGDFNTEEVIPMIEKKFGVWKTGELPEQKVYAEEAFNGREFIEGRMSPIKLGILGFRTVPNGHEDKVALEVSNMILSNENQTGLFDQLMLDNKIMAVMPNPMPFNDHGANLFIFIPKVIGQKLEEGEALVLQELQNLKDGKFDDWMLDAVKKQLYRNYVRSMESNESKALAIANAYVIGAELDDYLNYAKKVQAITKDDIMRVAKKYYGDNFLAFYSKMGKAKKDKIDKPGYEPLKANTNSESEYATHFHKLPQNEMTKSYIDFKQALNKTLIPGATVYSTANPVNDIFTLKIKFGVGEHEIPMLAYATQVMDLAGTEQHSVKELKQEFAKLGCAYGVYSDDSYTTLYMEGPDASFDASLKLLNELIAGPKLEEKQMSVMIDGEKTNRKMERSDADNVADALLEFVFYKDKSDYLDRLTMKEVKELTAEQMIEAFKKACKYEAEVHYVGNNPKAADIVMNTVAFNPEAKKSVSPVERNRMAYDENIIYFVNKKKARQSKIYYYSQGMDYNVKKQAGINAFNVYFGGGFSGLVLQEVREYRSLAYSAGANYSTPRLAGKNCTFIGFIGTQADKTSEGLEVFNGLVRDMPSKPERMKMIKDYLILSNTASQPSFRNMSETVLAWKHKGYTSDPSIQLINAYEDMTFEDITAFYNQNIKNQKMVIAIVGNKKKIDMKALKQYGKIEYIKEKKLYKK